VTGGSPYANIPKEKWLDKTKELVKAHPLRAKEIVDAVLEAWDGIFTSSIGSMGLKIGQHLYPQPQILGFFLHELIPYQLVGRHPRKWRRGETKGEKDIVYVPNTTFSIEIKTSSHADKIFGNRSYAQEGAGAGKFGYYLAVNFEKCLPGAKPCIRLIRFGWLDHSDWIGQTAATGQQARLSDIVERTKLLTLYRK